MSGIEILGGILIIVFVSFLVGIILLVVWLTGGSGGKENARKRVLQFLSKYDLTFSDLTTFSCRYVGGHPERNTKSFGCILFGVKNKKLLFFECEYIFFPSLGFFVAEGSLINQKVDVHSNALIKHLFDIPIDRIVDIRYFDATSRSVVIVGGPHWVIPINLKKNDASVLIDWNDGRYNHSTEFRFVGVGAGGHKAKERAEKLRNTLIKMTK